MLRLFLLKRLIIVDDIKYTKIGDSEYYAQELFHNKELTGYLSKNMIESKKSVYEYVVYDSDNEESFAESFEANSSVKLYAKSPDWCILIEKNGQDRLYFVIETKANILEKSLRPTESAKIKCGHKHFKALGQGAMFKEIDDFKGFKEERG